MIHFPHINCSRSLPPILHLVKVPALYFHSVQHRKDIGSSSCIASCVPRKWSLRLQMMPYVCVLESEKCNISSSVGGIGHLLQTDMSNTTHVRRGLCIYFPQLPLPNSAGAEGTKEEYFWSRLEGKTKPNKQDTGVSALIWSQKKGLELAS